MNQLLAATPTSPTTSSNEEVESLRRENERLKSLLLNKALYRKHEWEDLPIEWQENDLEAVLASLRAGVHSWRDLAEHWKENMEVVCVAFQESASRSDPYYVPSWKDLPFPIMTHKDVVIAALGNAGGPNWDQVPVKLKSDADVLYKAWMENIISFEDIPDHLCTKDRDFAWEAIRRGYISAEEAECINRKDFREAIESHEIHWNQLPVAMQRDDEYAKSLEQFFRKAIENFEIPWYHLPTIFQTDIEFVRSLSRENMLQFKPIDDEDYRNDIPFNMAMKLFYSILLCNESFREDRALWLDRLIDFGPRLFEDFAPQELRQDREFMLEACIRVSSFVDYADESFVDERSFISAVLAENPDFLRTMDHSMQLKYYDLVKGTVPVLGRWVREPCSNIFDTNKWVSHFHITSTFHPSFWNDHEFLMLWICESFDLPTTLDGDRFVLTDQVLEHMMSNIALRVAYAKHTGKLCSEDNDYELRGDCNVMKEIVEIQPFLYTKALGAAREDPWVLATALASSTSFAGDFLVELHNQGKDDEIGQIVSFVSEPARMFRMFSRYILGNMLSTQSASDTGTSLTLLVQDPDTSLGFKKRIAEYLGILTGKKLLTVLKAEPIGVEDQLGMPSLSQL